MTRFIITILLATCILECARADFMQRFRESVPREQTDIIDYEKIKNEAETELNNFQEYIEDRLNEVTTAQDGMQNEFMVKLKETLEPLSDEIENGSMEEDNHAKIKCMIEAKEKIDDFESMSLKIVQGCIEREEKVELNQLFNALLDKVAEEQENFKLLVAWVDAINAGNMRYHRRWERIPYGVRKTADSLKANLAILKIMADRTIAHAKKQTEQCSNDQLAVVRSSIEDMFHNCVALIRTVSVPEILTNMRQLRIDVATTLNDFKDYIDSRLNETVDVENNIKSEFMTELKKRISPFYDEIENDSVEEGNYAKIECLRTAKVKVDNLEAESHKIVEKCILRHEKVELTGLFNALFEYESDGNKMYGLIESLENDVRSGNYRDLTTFDEKKIPGIKAAADILKEALGDLEKSADQIIAKSKKPFEECSNKQLPVAVSSVIEMFNSCKDTT